MASSALSTVTTSSQAQPTYKIEANDPSQPSLFVGLAPDIILKILAILTPEEAARCRGVCHYFRVVGSDPELWNLFLSRLPANPRQIIERLFPDAEYTRYQQYGLYSNRFNSLAREVIPLRSCHFVRGWETVDMDMNGLGGEIEDLEEPDNLLLPIEIDHMLRMIQGASQTVSSHTELRGELRYMMKVHRAVMLQHLPTIEDNQVLQEQMINLAASQVGISRVEGAVVARAGNFAPIEENQEVLRIENHPLASEIIIPYRFPNRDVQPYRLVPLRNAPLPTTRILEGIDNPYYHIFSDETIRVLRDPNSSSLEKLQAIRTSILELQVPGMPQISTWTQEEKFSAHLMQILLVEVKKLKDSPEQLQELIPFIELLLLLAGGTSPMTGLQALVCLGPRSIFGLSFQFGHFESIYERSGAMYNALYAILDMQTDGNEDRIRFKTTVLRLLLQYGANPNQRLSIDNGAREMERFGTLTFTLTRMRHPSESAGDQAIFAILREFGASIP